MNLTLKSKKNFEQALEDLQMKVTENNFRVLHVHNVRETLKEKGFEIENYSIVEVCNAKFANEVLGTNKEYGVLMPCKINVYSDKGETFLSMPLPSVMIEKFQMKGVDEIAKTVEEILIKVMEDSV
ncbi:MAG: DUF302 domain-containing protein [Ignavibacteria bacterium]|nr:DUF302 domain-containing protein [Ignavibacteria bacterium]